MHQVTSISLLFKLLDVEKKIPIEKQGVKKKSITIYRNHYFVISVQSKCSTMFLRLRLILRWFTNKKAITTRGINVCVLVRTGGDRTPVLFKSQTLTAAVHHHVVIKSKPINTTAPENVQSNNRFIWRKKPPIST